MAKRVNPVREKLERMMSTKAPLVVRCTNCGVNQDKGVTTKEKLCVVTELHYPTFQNVFMNNRPTISPMVMGALRQYGIINAKEHAAYDRWVEAAGLNKKRKRRKPSETDVND